MITISIRFAAGRYHATPWGSHVNEGVTEWPPSPWRLLRALVATGFSKLGWNTVPGDARQLIERLATVLPEYRLPRGEVAHTRHYMPVFEGRTATTTKVFDTFVRLCPSDELLIRYQVDAELAEKKLLETLLTRLSYFGRAESWAEGSLVENVELGEVDWCRPCHNGDGPLPGGDQVSLLAPLTVDEYSQWYQKTMQQFTARDEVRGKNSARYSAAKQLAGYPPDLLACLTCETAFFQKHGWSQPPGSRRVLYNRPAETLKPRPATATHQNQPSKPVEAALLALSSDTKAGDLLPQMTRCVRQAEFIHEALVSILNRLGVRECPELIGKDARGNKLELGHQHAHYLPLDLDEDDRLDHFLIHAPMGLRADAQRAITRLRQTWAKDIDKPIMVTCVGFGKLELFRRQLRTRTGRNPPLLREAAATSWSSITPYVPARHLKPDKRIPYTIQDDVIRELGARNLPVPKEIAVFNYATGDDRRELVNRRLLQFVRARRKRGNGSDDTTQPPALLAFGLRLRFRQPIDPRGPLALGYASHFGLGLFQPDP